jgi:opacity protein-like surface antigen
MKLAGAWLAAAFAAAAFAADEDKDLALIPRAQGPAMPEVAPSPADRAASRVYVENAFALASRRDGLLVPSQAAPPARWEERLFADARIEAPLASNVTFVYSGRLSLRAEEDLGFPNRGNLTHDLREIYVSAEPRPREYLDAGRINVKNGVALGFNPTDFFKSRAVIEPLTADPRALREDRLGTLVVRGQRIGEAGSVSVAYAPRVAGASPPGSDPDRGFDPLFGRTNAADRWLAKASIPLADGFSPEALLYGEKGDVKIGANVTQNVGQASVAYLEWSGGRRSGLMDEALGRAADKRFRNQVAAGASYTTETRITFNLEYHYNGAGFSRADWDRWFALGAHAAASSPIARELWLVRGYASERQEPLQRHAIFLRSDWVDFLVPKLELTGFVLADVHDGSTLLQLEADYARTDRWSFGVLAGATTGGRRSNFGSLPGRSNVLLTARRYF